MAMATDPDRSAALQASTTATTATATAAATQSHGSSSSSSSSKPGLQQLQADQQTSASYPDCDDVGHAGVCSSAADTEAEDECDPLSLAGLTLKLPPIGGFSAAAPPPQPLLPRNVIPFRPEKKAKADGAGAACGGCCITKRKKHLRRVLAAQGRGHVPLWPFQCQPADA